MDGFNYCLGKVATIEGGVTGGDSPIHAFFAQHNWHVSLSVHSIRYSLYSLLPPSES